MSTRTAIVTGTSRDIGLATTRAVAADGSQVVETLGRIDVLVNDVGPFTIADWLLDGGQDKAA